MLRLPLTVGLLAAAAACASQGTSPEFAGAPGSPEARTQTAPPALPDPPGWRRVRATGRYSLAVPSSLERRHRQGVDSAVDQFVGDGVDLNLDYGLYSGGVSQSSGMQTERLPGDGRALHWTIQPANTTDPQYRFTFTARMSDPEQPPSTSPYPPPPGPGLTISMHCRTAELCQLGPAIARSVRFDRRPGSPSA